MHRQLDSWHLIDVRGDCRFTLIAGNHSARYLQGCKVLGEVFNKCLANLLHGQVVAGRNNIAFHNNRIHCLTFFHKVCERIHYRLKLRAGTKLGHLYAPNK